MARGTGCRRCADRRARTRWPVSDISCIYSGTTTCLAYNLRTKQSEVIAAPFTGARHSAAVVVGDRLYVIGGRHDASAEALDLVQVFTRRKQPEGREE
jgi:hypothetical protein